MALLILIALQLIGSAAAIGMLWRRSERQRRELAELRAQLDALSVQRVVQRPRREGVALTAVAKTTAAPTPLSPQDKPPATSPPRARGLPEEINRAFAALPVSAPLVRNFALTLAALAPALGFATHVSVVTMVGAGVVIGAAMMLVSLIPHWRQAAWAAPLQQAPGRCLALPLPQRAARRGFIAPSCPSLRLHRTYPRLFAPRRARSGRGAGARRLLVALHVCSRARAGQSDRHDRRTWRSLRRNCLMRGDRRRTHIKLESIHLLFWSYTDRALRMSGQDTAAVWFTLITAWAGVFSSA